MSSKTYYIDTSALIKLFVIEKESKNLQKYFSSKKPKLVSSALIETEVARTLFRLQREYGREAQEILDSVVLFDVTKSILADSTNLLPQSNLRAIDSIHIATCNMLKSGVAGLISYDKRMMSAASQLGITVFSPGLSS